MAFASLTNCTLITGPLDVTSAGSDSPPHARSSSGASSEAPSNTRTASRLHMYESSRSKRPNASVMRPAALAGSPSVHVQAELAR